MCLQKLTKPSQVQGLTIDPTSSERAEIGISESFLVVNQKGSD